MPFSPHPLWPVPLRVDVSCLSQLAPYLESINRYPPLHPPGAFFATISVTTARTVPIINVHTAWRQPQDILHICVCEPGAPFASTGAILIGSAHNRFAEIVINQGTFLMTVCFRTCPQNRPATSMETDHLCDELCQESVELVPGAQVYERGNVTVSYLNSRTFLICILHCMFFPLGLASYTEDRYTFSLGPRSFSLSPIPEGDPTPVPVLLFAS